MGRILFLTGPVRSGKSSWAVERASAWGPGTVFVATYRPDAGDAEMAERVERHRAERPGWRTLEAPARVAESLEGLDPPPSGVVLDCLTLWLGDRMEASDEAILGAWSEELAAFARLPWPIIIVGNEVGWCPVPGDAALRRFRDLAGWLGQATAKAADEAWLFVAGCPLRIK
ncbi:bifunctional adenosylcobinamide kinase/adenosylcobinamide-phosphate guanylyltransferase [Mesoterricola silvestris]|uniref:Adenosylcobinamide kinase n=1 Tax=Mesoterricola silvestris TaxID=2927979 RepID=A0AA48K7A7_9BACT|nr:bifunctional adenosylcobinamide kinase/adenosylcobinamide-phosphate guanylyltransferase [Mesoterricola silvestris]BDU70881.1 adenosylcobinamide kinase/adenosylcobinamide phosphate guanyltransferase [Mesoterricola silvestris]